MLLERPADDIVSVRISPKDSVAYTLVRQVEGFALQGREDAPLRASVMEEIMLSLGKVPAEAVVLPELNPEQGLTAAVFGLDQPQARVEITYADGEKKEMLYGNAAPSEITPQRYCMLTGDARVYTVIEADSEVFFHEMEYLLAFDQPRIDASLLDRIEVSGSVVWAAEYTPSGWQMKLPFSYPLSIQRMDALLSRIESMGFEAYLGDEADMDLSMYGLDAPEATVTLTQAATVITGETEDGQQVSFPVAEQEYVLKLGKETGKSGVYLAWRGRVYKASNFLLGFWKTLNPRDMVLVNPVNFLVNNLDEVSISASGVSGAYEVRMVESVAENNQIATDEYGQTLYDMAVRRAGESEDMDAEAFAAWYKSLAALSGDGALPDGFVLSGESRATITLKNSHLTRKIEFYPFDALHDAMVVDGVSLFYMQKERLDSVIAAIP
ncbi:MAG: DUF4340 domain-containing protein [Clostridia bacterium]|nr:DUF4340 domain-containing protein [Clostridia bacterium]